MTTVYAVRHGETPWNVEGRYQGQLDPPLNARGRQQAQITAKALAPLNIEAIYSSDLKRAVQTAEALARLTDISIRLDPRLREIHQGAWQGVLVEEIERRWPDEFAGWRRDPWHHRPPGGERLQDVQERVLAALYDIAARHPGGTVAVFTHKLPIALLKIALHGAPADRLWELLPANGAWEVFHVTPELLIRVQQQLEGKRPSATT